MAPRDAARSHRLSLAAVALAVAACWMDSAHAADRNLGLEVVINGARTSHVGEFVLRDGDLLAPRRELAELGLVTPQAKGASADSLVPLAAVHGLSFRIEEATQTLFLEAPAASLSVTRVGAGPARTEAPQTGAGLTLNYDLTADLNGERASFGSLLDLRAFSPFGVFSNTALGFSGPGAARPGGGLIRLDTSYVYSSFERDVRLRAGDFIGNGLSWTRPLRMGGVQVTHDFSMRPDLVTFPLPAVDGAVSVPSTVDVVLNGARVVSSPVKAGPFQVSSLPVVIGAGSVQLTVTNALGQQITSVQPFYASSALLQPGLSTWSLEAGAIRRNWGLLSADYGPSAASASYRRGLTQRITLEAHAEAVSRQWMSGAAIVANVLDYGVVTLGGAFSNSDAGDDGAVIFGAERLGRVLSFGVFGVAAGPDFRDLAAAEGEPYPRRQGSATLGLSFGRWGSTSFGYAVRDFDASPARPTPAGAALPPVRARRLRLATVSYSVQLRGAVVHASATREFANGGAYDLLIGVTLPLGPRRSASASVGGPRAYAQGQLQQSADVVGDLGYQVYANSSGGLQGFAVAQYKAPVGLFSAGGDAQSGHATVRLGALGALSAVGGRVYASNAIEDAFAVVDSHDLAGVRVTNENRYAGRTDRTGRLLVPDLRSYQDNHLAIDPTELPPDATVTATDRTIRPADRTGVVADIAVRLSHGALLVLVDAGGKPLPLGSRIRLLGSESAAVVGHDGEAFLENLGPENWIEVVKPDSQACAAAFAYRPLPGELPRIGPLTCGAAP